ncbi:hypothetical protein [Streptomyces anulatus]|uniref:hypothetical protein n=1 Tax=Streptomyces anulatus TaxID=1892 RepID=UPI003F49E967
MDDVRFLDLLENLCRRPGMFTGEPTVASVQVFLAGYFTGVSAADPEGPGLPLYRQWRQWIEVRYDVFHPAWPWTRILLHHHGADRDVFEVLPSLFRQFLADRETCGAEELEDRHKHRFDDHHRPSAPEHTHTVAPH